MSALILASRSAARARMLTDAGVRFEARAAEVNETVLKAQAIAAGQGPRGVARVLALAKAQGTSAARNDLVIGSDQTLELDGALFDKPCSIDEARQHLLALRGRSHHLHAAAAAVRGGTLVWAAVESVTLHVRAFSEAFLDAYLETEDEALLQCVGAYRLESLGAQLFERVDGDYFSVLGLPLLPLLAFLRAEGRLAA